MFYQEHKFYEKGFLFCFWRGMRHSFRPWWRRREQIFPVMTKLGRKKGIIKKKKKKKEKIVAKASDGQRYPMPLSKCWFEFEDERGSGPEGVADVHIDGIVCPINCTALFL